MLLLTELNTF